MKGIVVATKGDRCVVLQKDGTFSQIPNKHYSIGQEVELRTFSSYQKIFTAAACLALICTMTFSAHSLYTTPVSYIYLDINPSIRLDLNRFEKVISVVPLNEDAKTMLEAKPVLSHQPDDCIEEIVNICRDEKYLNTENSDIEINVMSGQNHLENTIQAVSTSLEAQEVLVSVFSIDQEENAYAVEQNISAKYLRAVREYTDFFGGELEENVQLLREKTVDEIYAAIRTHRRSTPGKDITAEKTLSLAGETGTASESSAEKIDNKEKTEHKKGRESTAHIKYIPEKRLEVLQQYTDRFGGILEDNIYLLGGLSTTEILNEVREYDRSTKANDIIEENISLQNKPRTKDLDDSEEALLSPSRTERRQTALKAYTDYFGGSIEQNAENLQNNSIGEIYEMIRTHRRNQK